MLIAYLNPTTKEDFLFKQWADLAKEHGVTLSYPLIASHEPDDYVTGLKQARHLIESADAFFLTNNDIFVTDPDLAKMLHQRVKTGSRLLVQTNVLPRQT